MDGPDSPLRFFTAALIKKEPSFAADSAFALRRKTKSLEVAYV